jgi:acetyltransferase
MEDLKIEQMQLFIEPKSVAIVGASTHTGELSLNILENLIHLKYQGAIYPVNPYVEGKEILGIKTYDSVKDIPEDKKVDLAIILTPRRSVPHAVKQCGERGIKAVIVVGQGFADAKDEEGRELQEELVRIAKENGTRIVGPNTIGVTNPFVNFSTSFVIQPDVERKPVGLICQSGIFFGSFPGLKLLGKGIDLGNACDVDFADCLLYFGHDFQTNVVVMHVEGIKEKAGRKLLEVAKRVAKKKPVIALKTGRSPHAAIAVQSHTGSLVGKEDVWDTVFRQYGITRVSDIDELGDVLKVFTPFFSQSSPSSVMKMESRRIGVITLSGGLGVIALDACQRYKMEIAELSGDTKQKIADFSPSWLNIANPVDLWPAMTISERPFTEIIGECLQAVLEDRGVDAVLLIVGVWFEKVQPPISDVVLEVTSNYEKPVVWAPYEGWLYNISSDEIAEKVKGKVAVFSTPDRAIRALARLWEYSQFRKKVDECK